MLNHELVEKKLLNHRMQPLKASLSTQRYLESALEILARLHQILDVVDVGEVHLQQLEEFSLGLGQVLIGQQVQLKRKE